MKNMFKIKNYNTSDTIVAIATFPAKSALGVIRISGKQTLAIVSKIFKPTQKKNLKTVPNFTIHYGYIVDQKAEVRKQRTEKNKEECKIIDEVLVSVMRKPNSYTKEDIIEISSHGGVLVLDKILKLILKCGARLALPGEFTYRAVVNGRIDLLQAQSISDIVEAKNEKGLQLAIKQLKGETSSEINKIKNELKDIFSETEAYINFPEDEVVFSLEKIKNRLEVISKKLNDLLSGSREAKALNEGLKCVICGKANVGKSTLFNYLLKEERVIVSSVAGTTRDVIEETINIKGVPLRIYDTAGILEPKDLVTKKAIEKSAAIFNQADLVILTIDGSRLLSEDDYFFIDKVKDKNAIIVITKADRKQKIDLQCLDKISAPKVHLSVLKQIGLDNFEQAVHNFIYRKGVARENLIFLSVYQQDLLKKAQIATEEALSFINRKYTFDFINLAIKESVENLGKLTGEVYCEEILDNIFSNFCIGK